MSNLPIPFSRMLFTLRLKWYRENMLIYLKRFRHILFITFFALLPAASEKQAAEDLARLIAHPFINFAQPSSSLLKELIILFLLLGFYTAWVFVQKKAIIGEPLNSFITTLPIGLREHWQTHIHIVLIANNIVWAGFVLAVTMAPYDDYSPIELATYILRLASFALLVLSLQVSWLFGSKYIAVAILGIGSFIIALKIISNDYIQLLVSILALCFSYLLFRNLAEINNWVFYLTRPKTIQAQKTIANPIKIKKFPLWRISLKLLFKERLWSSLPRILIALFLSTGMALLIQNQIKNNIILSTTFFISYLAWLAFIMSSLFCYLYDERQAIQPLLSSLPIRNSYWLFLDSSIIYILLIIVSAPYTVMLLIQDHLQPTNLAIISLYLLILILLLYPIRNKMPKQSSTTAIFSCVLWVLIAMSTTR